VWREDQYASVSDPGGANHIHDLCGNVECVEAPPGLGLDLVEKDHGTILTDGAPVVVG
jgi:hypothetical protein